MIRTLTLSLLALVVAACSEKTSTCWVVPEPWAGADEALQAMVNSDDPAIKASGHAQLAERCVDRLSNTYGRGRDAADTIADAVVAECIGDLRLQAENEAEQSYYADHLADLTAAAKRRSLILIVRDRAAKCI
jgi:hypothetical protein